MSCITLTVSTRGENHVGNQIIGEMLPGFDTNMLRKANGKLIQLNEGVDTSVDNAMLSILPAFCDDMHKELYAELKSLDWDSKCLMRGSVVNKHARHNLIFAWFDQEPMYDEGKGRIINISKLIYLSRLVDRIERFINSIGYNIKKEGLILEGNLYYNETCYIGFHGDSERKMVMGLRIGDFTMPLHFGWWKNKEFIHGSMKTFEIPCGSAYLMSEKAVGTDWKKHANNLATLRHAAGKIPVLIKAKQWHSNEEVITTTTNVVVSKAVASAAASRSCSKCACIGKYRINGELLCGRHTKVPDRTEDNLA